MRLATVSTTPDGFDPYGETKKYIGTRFQIEKFANEKQKNFDKNFLNGKPTFINSGLQNVRLVSKKFLY